MSDSEVTKLISGMAIVTLSLARNMELHGVIPEGASLAELQQRLTRLPPSLVGTGAEDVLRLSISWLQKDQGNDEETPSFSSVH